MVCDVVLRKIRAFGCWKKGWRS